MKFEVLFGTVIVIALIIVLGLMTFGSIQSTQTGNSSEYNATGKAISAFSTYSKFIMPIILIVMIIFVITVVSHFKTSSPV